MRTFPKQSLRQILTVAAVVTVCTVMLLPVIQQYRAAQAVTLPITRSALGLQVVLKGLERRPNGFAYLTYEIHGLKQLKGNLEFIVDTLEFTAKDPASYCQYEAIIRRHGDSAVVESRLKLPETVNRISFRQKVCLYERDNKARFVFKDIPVDNSRHPSRQKAHGFDIGIRRVYVNDFLKSGKVDTVEVPARRGGTRPEPVFTCGTSGERNMGVEVESRDISTLVLQGMEATLIDDSGQEHAYAGGAGHFVGGIGYEIERRVFFFSAINPSPKQVTLELTYQLPPDSKHTEWLSFENVPVTR